MAEDGTGNESEDAPDPSQHHSLKYHLLGPSLTKSGQEGVNQTAVSEIIYNASKGSKYFTNEKNKDKTLTVKINSILAKKRELQRIGLKKELKKADDYIAQLEYERDLSQTIVHIDCDAFYAAVEELDNPELKNVPFAVGKGVLTTCNYMARQFGCRSGMAGFVADKLCPQLIHVPLNFEKYTSKAKEVRAVLEQYDPRFESASIDEAYLNITKYCQDHNDMKPEEVVSQMREQVFQETKITISAGIAANAKLAKICSNMNKPNGQFKLLSERTPILNFMRDLPTRKVNGIGRVLERELDAVGIKTCGDIYAHRQYINRLFGDKTFEFLIGVYLGLGRTDVRPADEHERKSVGTESTFHDMSDPQELRDKLRHTAESLEEDLQRTEFKGRTLCLKVKLHTYEVFTRQVQPPKAVFTADELYHYSLPMLQKLEKEFPGMKLRLMGLRCTHLASMKKGDVDFFGRARQSTVPKPSGDNTPEIELDEDGWQKWPDTEFEDAAREERQQELHDLEQLSQEYAESASKGKPADDVKTFLQSTGIGVGNDYTRYGNGFAWRALLEAEAKQEEGSLKKPIEQWNCPICSLPQAVDEKKFNEHIDGCLSRQTIKEIVKQPSPTPEKKYLHPLLSQASAEKRKRGRPPAFRKSESSGEKRPKSSFFT